MPRVNSNSCCPALTGELTAAAALHQRPRDRRPFAASSEEARRQGGEETKSEETRSEETRSEGTRSEKTKSEETRSAAADVSAVSVCLGVGRKRPHTLVA